MIGSFWKAIGFWIQTRPLRSFLCIFGGVSLVVLWGIMESRRADRNNGHANVLCEKLELVDLDSVKAGRNAYDNYETMKSICRSRTGRVIAILSQQ
jgi:hypothetical protein